MDIADNHFLMLIAGLVLLLAGGEFLVKGSISLAAVFRVSTLVIGVTVVSLGTSAPELVVSVSAAIKGHNEIAMGNVIGSNIANIGLVLGLTVVLMPIMVDSRSLLFNWSVMAGATLLLYLFILDGELVRFEGILFLSLLVLFVWYLLKSSRSSMIESGGVMPVRRYSIPVSLLMVVISIGALALGAGLLIDGASGIARTIGVSERVISVSVIAFGTSLPELVTSAVAAFRREMDISIGNIVGSNIFNILAVLGTTATVKIVQVSESVIGFDMIWCAGIAVLLLLLLLPVKMVKVGRIKGLLLLIAYIIYIFMVFRGDLAPSHL